MLERGEHMSVRRRRDLAGDLGLIHAVSILRAAHIPLEAVVVDVRRAPLLLDAATKAPEQVRSRMRLATAFLERGCEAPCILFGEIEEAREAHPRRPRQFSSRSGRSACSASRNVAV